MDIFNDFGLTTILISSLIFIYFGCRFFKYLISLSGVLIFAGMTWKLVGEYSIDNEAVAIAITVAAGLLGIWLFHKLFKVACFLYGAVSGLSLSPIIMNFIDEPSEWLMWGLPVICGLGGGLLLLISHRVVLITVTAACGSLYFCLSSVFFLIQLKILEPDILDKPDKIQSGLFLLCFGLCFISGWIYQFKDKHSQET